MYAIPDGQYTINPTAKTITLTSLYTGITAGQISHIVDITSGEVLYDANAPRSRYTKITVSGLVISYEYGRNVKNTDKLRIMVDNSRPGVIGGTANLQDMIQFRHDSASNLATANPILAAGEPCYDTTNGWLKIGDGATVWNSLPAIVAGTSKPDVVGISWNTASSSPTLSWIDIDGNTVTGLTSSYFNNHSIWGNMKRCVINPSTGVVTYGTNARGDGLDLTGASGNVMVKIPKFYVKFSTDGTVHKWWISPIQYAGFELHPAFLQRGGTEAELFVSAYEASGYLDGSTFKLRSATNKQPVTGAVAYPDLPNSGRLYITDAETYANNIASTAWGITNIWTLSALRLLFYTEYASLDSQTALDKGIVDLASGTDFAGLLTGALSADTNIGTNGTGTGTGTAGQRPIVYRGIENLWGNVYKWIGGIRFYDTVHRIIPAAGTSFPSEVTTAGKYVDSVSVPPNTSIAANGYINAVFTDSYLKYMMMGATTTGSSSTYLCDSYYIRTASATPTCMLFGGHWYHGQSAGVGFLNSAYSATYSLRLHGARLEFLKR
jgi:hypothetical protein